MGIVVTLMREMTGSLMVRGSSMRMRVMASFTSLRARSALVSSWNSTVVTEAPSVSTNVMCLTPTTGDTASSTRRDTWVSSSDGEAPACVTVTEISGKSMFGKRSTGKPRNAMTPSAVRMRNRMIDGTGRRIDQAETLRRISGPRSPVTEPAGLHRRRAAACRSAPPAFHLP